MRTLIVMMVSLYTSRVVFQSLGVDDFGIYNVIAGFIGMLSVVSSPISTAISRFLTYGLGKGDNKRMQEIFSTSINIQIVLSIIVLLLGETVGLWFINSKLNIPEESMVAANWVYQCSIASMVLNLFNTPYMASLIAHEKMSVFAYMAIIEVVLKLAVAFLVIVSPINKLIFYSLGLLCSFIIIRVIYWSYCTRKFEECHYRRGIHMDLAKEMTGFAWWSFFGSTAWIINTQGTSILMNLYFGVVLNAAKGIAVQAEGAVTSFISNFTTAFSPQITKSYAEGNKEYMFNVISRGAKFSVYLFLFIIIPVEFETKLILELWLGEVPDYTVQFLQLSLWCSVTTVFGSSYLQGINATGKIRSYQLVVTSIGILIFPLTWLAYRLGFCPESYYFIYFVIYNILIFVRIGFVRAQLGYSLRRFIFKDYLPVVSCCLISVIPAWAITKMMDDGVIRLIVITLTCCVTTSIIVFTIGMSRDEQRFIITNIKNRLSLS